jgi:hypothetical protein
MKRTRDDVVEILCIALIVAAFCLPAQGLRLVQGRFNKPGLMFLRAPRVNLTFSPWNR